MKKEQKVLLVPMEFSNNSYNALDYAINKAKENNEMIVLVHAIQENYSDTSLQNLIVSDNKLTKNNVNAKLEELVLRIQKKNKAHINYEIRSEFGAPSEVILNVIKKINSDYVILGENKSGNILNALFWNLQFNIPPHTKCQMIIIPEEIHYTKINRIVFATDYHERDISAIVNLTELVPPNESKITVLHFSDGDLIREFEETMLIDFSIKIKKKIQYEHISFQLIEGQNINAALGKYVNKKNADMFALSTNLHGWLNKFFGKSITAQMLQQTKIPILIYYTKEESDLLYTKTKSKIYENTF